MFHRFDSAREMSVDCARDSTSVTFTRNAVTEKTTFVTWDPGPFDFTERNRGKTGYQWRWPQYGGHQAQFAEGSFQTE